ALGREASAAMFAGASYEMAKQGYLTGAGPSDPALREHMHNAGWQEFSVYSPVTGKCYSYKPLLATLPAIGAAATLAEIAPELKDNDIYTVAQGIMLSVTKAALDHPFWQGASEFFDAVGEIKDKGTTAALEKFVNNR